MTPADPAARPEDGGGVPRGLTGSLTGGLRALVTIMPREGLLDPQGEAIGRALGAMGFAGVRGVRQGKVIALDLDPGTPEAEVRRMCDELLANSVIEDYRVEIA